MNAEYIATLRAEAERFGRGSPDWEYRRRAAWALMQRMEGVPPCDWTDPPAGFWADTERKAA